MADPITQAAAAFANWAYATFFAAAGYGTTAHAIISATLYYGAQAALYAGVSMGLNAVAQAQVPNPEGNKITKKQPRPARQYCGGGYVRMSGPYMLRETVSSHLAVVIAISDFRLGSFNRIWLNDDEVVTIDGWVQEGADKRYGTGDLVRIDHRAGHPIETRYSIFPPEFATVWPATARGDGIGSLAMYCQHRSRESFSQHFPNGEPIPSAEVRAVCYDWRDASQNRDNPATWKSCDNPVVWMVFLEWVQIGRSWSRAIAPVLDDLTAEANYCDDMVAKKSGTQKRYTWAGGWDDNTEPDAIRQNLLQTFDGWLTTDGRGCLVIKAGRYVEPTFVIPPEQIQAFTWRRGQPEEDSCNKFVVAFTSPAHAYTVVECDPWLDEEDIALVGDERSEPLSLLWVDNHPQARRLAKRKMLRVNAKRRGSVTTDIWGLAGLGERYIRIQNTALKSMSDVVCEVMNVDIDVNNSRVTFDVILANPSMDDWNPALEEGAPVPIPAAPPVWSFVEQPSEFTANVLGSEVTLTWRNPFDSLFDFVHVYRGPSESFAAATVIDYFGGALGQLVTVTDSSPLPTGFYWLVSVDSLGRSSAPLGPVQAKAKTYEDFVDHITDLATDGLIPWDSPIGIDALPWERKYRTTAAAFVGQLYGSPAAERVATGSGGFNWVARTIQHSLPEGDLSGAVSGRQVYFEIEREAGSNPGLISKTVNGYTSLSIGGGVVGSGYVRRIIWWDGVKAMWRDPAANSAPLPYGW